MRKIPECIFRAKLILDAKTFPKDEFGPWAITGGHSGEAARERWSQLVKG